MSLVVFVLKHKKYKTWCSAIVATPYCPLESKGVSHTKFFNIISCTFCLQYTRSTIIKMPLSSSYLLVARMHNYCKETTSNVVILVMIFLFPLCFERNGLWGSTVKIPQKFTTNIRSLLYTILLRQYTTAQQSRRAHHVYCLLCYCLPALLSFFFSVSPITESHHRTLPLSNNLGTTTSMQISCASLYICNTRLACRALIKSS